MPLYVQKNKKHVPLSPPYWLESSLLNMRSSFHPPRIRSSDFDKTAVNEIGLKSLLSRQMLYRFQSFRDSVNLFWNA